MIKENVEIQDKGATKWMETNQASFPERGRMVRWVIVRKENILGCKTAAGFVRVVNHRVIFLGKCGVCLINPSLCSIF